MRGMQKMTSDIFVSCVKPKLINDTEYVGSYSFQLHCLFQIYSKGSNPANKLYFANICIHAKFLPN